MDELILYGDFCERGRGAVFAKVLRGEWELALLTRPIRMVCTSVRRDTQCITDRRSVLRLSESDIYMFCVRHEARLLRRPNITDELSRATKCISSGHCAFWPLLTRIGDLIQWPRTLRLYPRSLQCVDLMYRRGTLGNSPYHITPEERHWPYLDLLLKSHLPASSSVLALDKYTSGYVQAVFGIGRLPYDVLVIIFEMAYGKHVTSALVDNAIFLCAVKTKQPN
jgi:hypothetical protein